ncbi:hypothetical protein [Cyanobacterium aponinum]|uniref:Cyanobacterial membrane protein, in cluster with PxcA n=1 Tax=Cyanobacterium aponinum (strain PCC 10605) TaxID=755178 RepID=K9Z197_CYAAP|nr:hypothetical protein [Cyanobacterium aponinum]AFZ52340.1 hypothetical protein Cyan10605_0184 [Cyanobacterium aponinum PCC 10605]
MNKGNKPLWITGESCCGKTRYLAQSIYQWMQIYPLPHKPLILVINHQARENLLREILKLNAQGYLGKIRTPLGLIMEDVNLFYPLICEKLDIKAKIPIRLRPETEQELATQLWQKDITSELISIFGNEYTCVRRILDLTQLAGAAGIPFEKIPDSLQNSDFFQTIGNKSITNLLGELIQKWRNWCLEKGFLNYGLIYELYALYLLPSGEYEQYLLNQYKGLFIDDIDDFPSIITQLCQRFIDNNITSVFTYNETGKVRLGLNADPEYIKEKILPLCNHQVLENKDNQYLKNNLEKPILKLINGDFEDIETLANISSIITESRAELLSQTCNFIIKSIQENKIKPQDIAIIAPGLDEIARYTFQDIFTNQNGVAIQFLREKRPLVSSAIIRSILSILTLVYSHQGRLVRKDLLPEMLVILSKEKIDLVRANLLVDSCYVPDVNNPFLLDYTNFSRWDRLSYQSRESYQEILALIENIKAEISEGNNHLIAIIDKIIQLFFPNLNELQYNQITNLKEFIETAQHFWEIQYKLGNLTINEIVSQFLTLIRKGTITANPLLEYNQNNSDDSEDNFSSLEGGLLISTIYQYRSHRCRHRWQFWMDTGSRFWSQGLGLFAYEAFLQPIEKNAQTMPRESEDILIRRIVKDLLARAEEKIFLCHSDLSVTGNEQIGKLSPLLALTP